MADADTIRRLWRYKSDLEEGPDEEKLLEILGKLKRLRVSIASLQETGVGKMVNSYRKHPGVVGQKALEVVDFWKSLVENEVETLEKSKKRSPRSDESENDHGASDADSWNSFQEEGESSGDGSDHEDSKGRRQQERRHSSSHSKQDSKNKVEREKYSSNKHEKHKSSHHSSDGKHRQKEKRDDRHSSKNGHHHSTKNEGHHSSKNEGHHSSKTEGHHSSKNKDSHSSKTEGRHSSKNEDIHSSKNEDSHSSQTVDYIPTKKSSLDHGSSSHNTSQDSRKSDKKPQYIPSSKTKSTSFDGDTKPEYIPSKKHNGTTGSGGTLTAIHRHNSNTLDDDDLTDSDADVGASDAESPSAESKASEIEEYYKAMLAQQSDTDDKMQAGIHKDSNSLQKYPGGSKDKYGGSVDKSGSPKEASSDKQSGSSNKYDSSDNKQRSKDKNGSSDRQTKSKDRSERSRDKSKSTEKQASSKEINKSDGSKEEGRQSRASSSSHKHHGTESRKQDNSGHCDQSNSKKLNKHDWSHKDESARSSHHRSKSKESKKSDDKRGQTEQLDERGDGALVCKVVDRKRKRHSMSDSESDTDGPSNRKVYSVSSSTLSQTHGPASPSPLPSLPLKSHSSSRRGSSSRSEGHSSKSSQKSKCSSSERLSTKKSQGDSFSQSLVVSDGDGPSYNPTPKTSSHSIPYVPSKKIKTENPDSASHTGVSLEGDSLFDDELYSPTCPSLSVGKALPKNSKMDDVKYSPTPVSKKSRNSPEKYASSPLHKTGSKARRYSPTTVSSNPKVKEERYSPTPVSSRTDVKEERYSPTPVSSNAKVKEERYSPTPVSKRTTVKEERYSPTPVLSSAPVKEERYSPTPVSRIIKEERYSPKPVTNHVNVKEERYSPIPISSKIKVKEERYSPTPLKSRGQPKTSLLSDSDEEHSDHSMASGEDYSPASRSSKKDTKTERPPRPPSPSFNKHSLGSDARTSSKDRAKEDSSGHRHSGSQKSSSSRTHDNSPEHSKSSHRHSHSSSFRDKGKGSSKEDKVQEKGSSHSREKASSSKDKHSSSSHSSGKASSSHDKKNTGGDSSTHVKNHDTSSSSKNNSSHSASSSAGKREIKESQTTHPKTSDSSTRSSSTSKHKKVKPKPTYTEPDLDLFSDAIQIKKESAHPAVKFRPDESHKRTASKPSSPSRSSPAPISETLKPSSKLDSGSTRRKPVIESDSENESNGSNDMLDDELKDTDKLKNVKPKKVEKPTIDDSAMSFDDFLNFNEAAVVKKLKTTSKSSGSKASPTPKSSGSKASPSASHSSKSRDKPTPSPTTQKQAKSETPHVKLGSYTSALSVPTPSKNLVVTEKDILSLLPETHAQYKPLRYNPYYMDDVDEPEPQPLPSLIDPDSIGVKSAIRTQVYSGRKHGVTEIKPLFDLCMQVLIENIDFIDSVGGIPYSILKPVLERCTAQQLYQLEDYNPHFLEDTDELWESLCKRDFRGSKREELESWRELYMRRFEERELKYQKLKENMSTSIVKGQAGRKAQLAYVDTVAKPPREVLRKQKQYGTGSVMKTKGNMAISGGSSGVRTYKPSLLVAAHNPMNDEQRMVRPMPPMMAKSLQMRKNMRR